MNQTHRPAALIFDLDGTLLDTEPLYTDAAQKVMDPYGAVYTPELKRKSMGGDSRVSARLAIDHGQLPLTVDEYLSQREEHLLHLFPDAAEMPGAGSFIEQLHASDLPFGLATSSHRHLCDLKLSRKPWGRHFRKIVCGDDPRIKQGKPAPDIFLICADELGVDPSACIAFEDSPNGIEAASKAGMKVIAIASPYIARSELAALATQVIDSYEELASLLNHWQAG